LQRDGVELQVRCEQRAEQWCVEFAARADQALTLHWGVCRRRGGRWKLPPRSAWPASTRQVGSEAVQTPFEQRDGSWRLDLQLPVGGRYEGLAFVLFQQPSERWIHCDKGDCFIELPQEEGAAPFASSPVPLLGQLIADDQPIVQRIFDFGAGQLAAAVVREHERARVIMVTNITPPLVLHWATRLAGQSQWVAPPPEDRPVNAEPYDARALRSPFLRAAEGPFQQLELEVHLDEGVNGLYFVLFVPTKDSWLKQEGHDSLLPLAPPQHSSSAAEVALLVDEIAQAELGRSSWTLMHRFDLCTRLLDRVAPQREALVLLYVWLRYSAIRQLDWQRRYNTKPRELAHAQDRLTSKLARLYRDEPSSRPLVRLMLTTVGRGANGQRVRDEILEIMHRHKIKEVANHFMEEWHQKLHNNTTPDDIAICAAYLDFLRSEGVPERFYERLEQQGVTPERLRSYDRPIKTEPDYVPQLRDGLIHDFERFLLTLKAVHEGTDLRVAVEAASAALDTDVRALLEQLVSTSGATNDGGKDSIEATLAGLEQVARAREAVARLLAQPTERLRELLYLDLALENQMRTLVEGSIHLALDEAEQMKLLALTLRTLQEAPEGEELEPLTRHWSRLSELPRRDDDWLRQAYAVVERLRRTVADRVDRLYQLLQPRAQSLGEALGIDRWAIDLFAEEVVRGRPTFALSLLLNKIERKIRNAARMSDWQVISRGEGGGYVEAVEALRDVQGVRYVRPTVLLAERVEGDEEIPEGVTAVLTPDFPDLVSHVAVRARNAGLLFASCFDQEVMAQLSAMTGRSVSLAVTSDGDVRCHEGADAAEPVFIPGRKTSAITRPTCSLTSFAVSSEQFVSGCVGAKSLNLKRLAENLPAGVHVPPSVALPFGAMERTLQHRANRDAARSYERLCRAAGDDALSDPAPLLLELQQQVRGLEPPAELLAQLKREMEAAAIDWPESAGLVWDGIKEVWASLWTDRAYLSRRARGIAHDAVAMAVLVQRIIPADYAFVIHTTNPLNGDERQLYAEVVLGLGETLVGNYPGRSLGFVFDKDSATSAGQERVEVLTYPSKSHGLFGEGLILRSDSSAEDLADFAGAGLYESVAVPSASPRVLDYSEEPLFWDPQWRCDLLRTIGRLGVQIEQVFGSPQDIEGVVRSGRCFVVQSRPQVGVETAT
jgi:alpha-glucan,water dikinase